MMGRKKRTQTAYDMGYRHGLTDGRDEGYLAALDDADLMGADEARCRFDEPDAQPGGTLNQPEGAGWRRFDPAMFGHPPDDQVTNDVARQRFNDTVDLDRTRKGLRKVGLFPCFSRAAQSWSLMPQTGLEPTLPVDLD